MTRPDWADLAARLGTQSAPYLYDEEWQLVLRPYRCQCGAIIEVIDDGAAISAGEYLCDACTLRHVFMIEDVAATEGGNDVRT